MTSARPFFLVTSIVGRSGELAHEELFQTFDAAAKLFRNIDDPVSIIEVNVTAGTSKDRTRDVLTILANESFNNREPLHYELDGLCEAYGVETYHSKHEAA